MCELTSTQTLRSYLMDQGCFRSNGLGEWVDVNGDNRKQSREIVYRDNNRSNDIAEEWSFFWQNVHKLPRPIVGKILNRLDADVRKVEYSAEKYPAEYNEAEIALSATPWATPTLLTLLKQQGNSNFGLQVKIINVLGILGRGNPRAAKFCLPFLTSRLKQLMFKYRNKPDDGSIPNELNVAVNILINFSRFADGDIKIFLPYIQLLKQATKFPEAHIRSHAKGILRRLGVDKLEAAYRHLVAAEAQLRKSILKYGEQYSPQFIVGYQILSLAPLLGPLYR